MADDRGPSQPDSRRPALIGLLVIAVLVVCAYFLVTALRNEGNREDCMMAGRSNCAPISVPLRNR